MTIPRAVSVTLAVLAVAMLATSTLGYSSASVERGVQVNVVDAEDAYVNATACATAHTNASGTGAHPVTVTVTNQYVDSFTVESITWSDDAHPQKEGLEPGDVVGPGSSVTYENAFGTDEVTVEVSGPFEATVTVNVEPCSTDGSGHEDGSKGATPTTSGNESATTSGNESATTAQS